jgi:hypothetical protein
MQGVSSLTLFAAFWSWDTQLTRWIVWGGLVVLTVSLLLLIRTRWGQSQPLGKCVVLSLLAHLLLGIYMTTVNIVTATVGSPDGDGIRVALLDTAGAPDAESTRGQAAPAEPALGEPLDTASVPRTLEGLGDFASAAVAKLPDALPPAEPERQPVNMADASPVAAHAIVAPSPQEAEAPLSTAASEPVAKPSAPAAAQPIEAPQSAPDNPEPVPPPEQPAPPERSVAPTGKNGERGAAPDNPTSTQVDSTKSARTPGAGDKSAGGGDAQLSGAGTPAGAADSKSLPSVLRQRVGDHIAKGQGATPKTEAAVKDALAWLAANQRSNGRWDARALGAGAARAADGEDRLAAGSHADSGITGLALLAFLAGGHTHLQGGHQVTVRRGLESLLNTQDAEGCLAGTTNKYERMYCHAMAACALSEAFAMTADKRLQSAVRNAVRYTVRAQDRASGGWRYQPSEPGDTSQLGWQLMSLKSAELAGIPISPETRDGVVRFLRGVSAGRHGGLACYQPVRPIASRSMTAEALACRRFLGVVDNPQTLDEASAFLLQELPGTSTTNHYYWYYATLALYQTQGEPWQRWNDALQASLLTSQRRDGALLGSWDPDPVWGGCGGRAYSTALSTLCLEVYYRFLPLYVEAAGRDRRTK